MCSLICVQEWFLGSPTFDFLWLARSWSQPICDGAFLFYCALNRDKAKAVSKSLAVKRSVKTQFCPSLVIFHKVTKFLVRKVHSSLLTAAGNPVTSMVRCGSSVIGKNVENSVVACLHPLPVTLTERERE